MVGAIQGRRVGTCRAFGPVSTPDRQLKSGPCSVLATRFYAVAYSEILEGELSLSVVERTTAAKAGQLFVARWWRFNADNSVLRIAGLAPKNKGREI